MTDFVLFCFFFQGGGGGCRNKGEVGHHSLNVTSSKNIMIHEILIVIRANVRSTGYPIQVYVELSSLVKLIVNS